jgi:endogenous inhibitor of DNA gyrase (YacG/DUF329 family)
MTVKCPICKKPVEIGSADFPFCSERCRIIDLGAWASEEYKISSPANPQSGGSGSGEDDDA